MLKKMFNLNIISFLLFFSILYYFVASFGYGNDSDIFRLIQSGQLLLNEFEYNPSRYQGNLIPEIIIGLTSLFGGHYLSNAISVLLGIASLYICYNLILSFLDEKDALITILIIALNPYFIILSTTSMDYIYSLFFILLGIYFLQKKYYWVAALVLAFSLSSRLPNAFLVLFVYLYFITKNVIDSDFLESKTAIRKLVAVLNSRVFLSSILSFVIFIFLYLPVFILYDYSFDFINYSDPSQTHEWLLKDYLERFVYRNVYVLGIFNFLIIYLGILFSFFIFLKNESFILNGKRISLIVFLLLSFLSSQVIFFKLPTEVEFLVPLLFIIIPLFVYLIKNRLIKYIVILSMFSYSFILNADVAKINYCENVEESYESNLEFNLKKGVIVEDLYTYDYFCHKSCPSVCEQRKKDELLLKREHSSIYYSKQNLLNNN